MAKSNPVYQNASTALYHGDCRDVMAALDADSIDAILTDPPYGLSFMGKDWDRHVPGAGFWREALRVAKPGAHMLAFGGTRTFHRLTVAIEDAGWEVRDVMCWLYGSGFPKSLDVSKAIDKEAGHWRGRAGAITIKSQPANGTEYERNDKGEPITDEAAEWSGWGTALKPAWEPIILCRKPLAKGHTVAANVLRYGTGAVNVDGCRIGTETRFNGAAKSAKDTFNASPASGIDYVGREVSGRWPSNVLHDGSPEVLAGFPMTEAATANAISDERESPFYRAGEEQTGGVSGRRDPSNSHTDNGGSAARFFYTAKASSSDRGHGNTHPTVKPTDLLQYLARLITPPGGTILDPFMGSGSTGVATIYEGFRFVGIDLDRKWVDVAWQRLAQQSLFSQGSSDG